MALMTVDDMREKMPFFKGKSRASVHNFLRTRSINPVLRGQKLNGRGSGQNMYDADEVFTTYNNHPISGEKGLRKQVFPGVIRRYKKPHEIDDYEFGGNVPFRNYKCPKYKECSDNFVTESFKKKRWSRDELNCSDCEMKDETDPDWRLK